jgi:hypothetical protein
MVFANRSPLLKITKLSSKIMGIVDLEALLWHVFAQAETREIQAFQIWPTGDRHGYPHQLAAATAWLNMVCGGRSIAFDVCDAIVVNAIWGALCPGDVGIWLGESAQLAAGLRREGRWPIIGTLR